jgi:preprotein translocase subunit SecE
MFEIERIERLTNRSMKQVWAYIQDSVDEIRSKVTWPKFSELQSSAILVLVASLIFAIVIGAIDVSFKEVLAKYYKNY